MKHHLLEPLLRLVKAQGLGLLALMLVLTGGAAYAAAAKDSVTSRSIKNGQVKNVDLKNNAVSGAKIAADTVTGDDVDESTLGTVADAATVGGLSPSSFARTTVYKREAAVDAGTALGDGTFSKFVSCDAGDILLNGGPANLNATTDLVETFPTPASTNSWSSRVDKNGVADNWNIVILCLDQP